MGATCGEVAAGVVVRVERNPDLLEIVGTLEPVGRFSNFLNSRKQQANKDRNNRDHHQ
jgi:hypothetical protein